MELTNKTFKTPAVTLTSAHIATPRTFTDKETGRVTETREILVYFSPEENAEHKEFLSKVQSMEQNHKSTNTSINKRAIKIYSEDKNAPSTFGEHPTDKSIKFKTKAKNTVDVLVLEGEKFSELLNPTIPYGSEVIIEGNVVAWPQGDATFEGGRGISLQPTKVRVLRMGKATANSTN